MTMLPQRPLWRLRLARRIYPWWTSYEVDAFKWRAHVKRRELGLVRCVEADEWDKPLPAGRDTP